MILEARLDTEVSSRVVEVRGTELLEISKLDIDDLSSELMLGGMLMSCKVEGNTVVVSSIILGSVVVVGKEVRLESSGLAEVSEVDEIGTMVGSDDNSESGGILVRVSGVMELSKKLDDN